MKKPNKICKKCGRQYFSCKTCDEANAYFAWRKYFCRRECFQEYMIEEEKNKK